MKKERNKWIEDNKNRISSISYVGIETCFSCIRAFKRLLFYIHIFLFLVSCSFLTSSFWHESLQQNYKMYLLPENSFFFRLFHFSLSLHVRLVCRSNQKFIKCKKICFVSFCILSLSLDTFGLVSFDRIHFFSPLHDRFLCERVWVRFLLFCWSLALGFFFGRWVRYLARAHSLQKKVSERSVGACYRKWAHIYMLIGGFELVSFTRVDILRFASVSYTYTSIVCVCRGQQVRDSIQRTGRLVALWTLLILRLWRTYASLSSFRNRVSLRNTWNLVLLDGSKASWAN